MQIKQARTPKGRLFVDNFIDIANLLNNEDLAMGFVHGFALEQLSSIYNSHFDGVVSRNPFNRPYRKEEIESLIDRVRDAELDGFVTGDQGDDSIERKDGNDLLIGGGGADDLNAGKGDDYLRGGTGNDYLNGGLDSDVLTGGEGSDRFVYRDLKESGVGAQSRDVITDFSSSEDDKIDLSAIADHSVFIGSSDFTGTKPEIRFDDGILQLAAPDFYTPLFKFHEPDSAPTPVFEIQLLGVDSLSVDDLIM